MCDPASSAWALSRSMAVRRSWICGIFSVSVSGEVEEERGEGEGARMSLPVMALTQPLASLAKEYVGA